MDIKNPAKEDLVKKFRAGVTLSCPSLVTLKEQRVMRSLPLSMFEKALNDVYQNDLKLARDVMLERVDDSVELAPEKEVRKIATIEPASNHLSHAINERHPILLISDVDNDGSLAQAIGMEAKRIMDIQGGENHPVSVQSRDYDPANHGFSVSQIESWAEERGIDQNDEFTVLIADLGTNQRDTQGKFLAKYPNARLIICDHHRPELGVRVEESMDRSWLISPFSEGGFHLSVRKGGGASGGYLLYELLRSSLDKLRISGQLPIDDLQFKTRMEPLKQMAKAANLLDNVDSDIRLKPLKEADVEKAVEISSLARGGRALGKWLDSRQPGRIQDLAVNIGQDGVDRFAKLRKEAVEQNHYARALYEILPDLLSGEQPKKSLSSMVAEKITKNDALGSEDVNYFEKLRPYLYNFNYENQFDSSFKEGWLDFAKNVFRNAGTIEKNILETVREYSLVREISNDFAMITRSASTNVENVFTTNQLKRAYHSQSKAVDMSISSTANGRIVMNVSGQVDMRQVVSELSKSNPSAKFEFRGHNEVGGLTITPPARTDLDVFLKKIADDSAVIAKELMDLKPLPQVIKVNPAQLPLMKEIMSKMRLHLDTNSAPTLILGINNDMTIEDKYSLKKKTVRELVADNEWVITPEGLDFGGNTALLLPNQALKAVANDDFESALGLKLLPNGSFIANEVVSGERLAREDVPEIKMPLERERAEMMEYYKENFQDKELPLVEVKREDAEKALQFTNDGKSVHATTEAAILGALRETGAKSYVVLDVEADGAGNAQCFNVGMAIYQLVEGSGTIMSEADFQKMSSETPDAIKNFAVLDNGDVVVNEEAKLMLSSQIIGSEGGEDIRVSIKAQNLTNLTGDELSEFGCSAEEAQKHMMNILKDCGKVVVQAHNLPYDNNIIRVNFPELYELFSESIHLDTAKPAKDKQIAYVNLMTVPIGQGRGAVDFADGVHEGYNLSSLLADKTKESFDYPSVKGNKILRVRGEEVHMFDPKSRVTTLLPETREELLDGLSSKLRPMSSPRYSIEKIMRMSTVYDIISQQPVKETKKVEFDSFGSMEIPPELWEHFQDCYAYELSPSENLSRFMLLPEVAELVEKEFKSAKLEDVPQGVVDARMLGNGKEMNPSSLVKKQEQLGMVKRELEVLLSMDNPDDATKKKIKSTKAKVTKMTKEASAQSDALSSFNGRDVLMANILNFVSNNNENADRYAMAWVYDMVLDHYESTAKKPSKGLIDGVAQATGVNPEIVSKIYQEAYDYRDFRGIKSYKVHETHNNIGLEGDVFQEVNAVMYMLNNKVKNPYLSGKYAFQRKINPLQPLIDVIKKQCASSTMAQNIRMTTNVALDDEVFNTYSAKQLQQFSDSGISLKGVVGTLPVMKLKTLSGDKTPISVELVDFKSDDFKNMSEDDRKLWEQKLELAVTTLVLSASRKEGKAGLSPDEISQIERLVTHPDLIKNMEEVNEKFGMMFASRRESQIKALLKNGSEAILGNETLKFPINKELNLSDLDICLHGLTSSIERLKEEQNFESQVTPDDIEEAINIAKGQYLAFEEVRQTGQKAEAPSGYEELDRYARAQQTTMIKKLESNMQDHLNVMPELTRSMVTTKDDPMSFVIKSPLMKYMSEGLSPKLSFDMDDPSLENDPALRRRQG
jgi:hypothetical protein